MRPEWTNEQAKEWLEDNEKYIEDVMITAGWEAIEALIPEEGVKP